VGFYLGGCVAATALISQLIIGRVALDQLIYGAGVGVMQVMHRAFASPVWRSVVDVTMVALPADQERHYTSSRAGRRRAPPSLLFGLMLPFVVPGSSQEEWQASIGILAVPAMLLCIRHRNSRGAALARVGAAILNVCMWRPLSMVTLIFSHGAATLELSEVCSPSEVVLVHCLISSVHFCAVTSVRPARTELTIQQELIGTQLMLLLFYVHITTTLQVFAAQAWCLTIGQEHQAGVVSIGGISCLIRRSALALQVRLRRGFGGWIVGSGEWHAHVCRVATIVVLVSLVIRLVECCGGPCGWWQQLLTQLLIPSAVGVGSLLGVQYVQLPPALARAFWDREFDEQFHPFKFASVGLYFASTVPLASHLNTMHAAPTRPYSPSTLEAVMLGLAVPVSVGCVSAQFLTVDTKVLAMLKAGFFCAQLVCVSCTVLSSTPDFIGPLSMIYFVGQNLLVEFLQSWQLVLLMCCFFLSSSAIGLGIADSAHRDEAGTSGKFPAHLAVATLVMFLVTSLQYQFQSRRAWLAESARARDLDRTSHSCSSQGVHKEHKAPLASSSVDPTTAPTVTAAPSQQEEVDSPDSAAPSLATDPPLLQPPSALQASSDADELLDEWLAGVDYSDAASIPTQSQVSELDSAVIDQAFELTSGRRLSQASTVRVESESN
jgi:hypothetical protein